MIDNNSLDCVYSLVKDEISMAIEKFQQQLDDYTNVHDRLNCVRTHRTQAIDQVVGYVLQVLDYTSDSADAMVVTESEKNLLRRELGIAEIYSDKKELEIQIGLGVESLVSRSEPISYNGALRYIHPFKLVELVKEINL